MRYRLTADNPLEWLAVKTRPAIRALFDPFIPIVQSQALMTAVRLGLFEALAEEESAAAELAQRLGVNDDALRYLLDVLVSHGYLKNRKGIYRLAGPASSALLRHSPSSLVAWVEFNRVHWQVLAELEDTVRTGKGHDPSMFVANRTDRSVQSRAMFETAKPAAAWVASHVPVRQGAELLMDIGGSHGLYGAAIARKHPPMRAEVLELEPAVEAAREVAEEAGLTNVVSYRALDVRDGDLGRECCDVMFLGNIIHHFPQEQIIDLFGRMYQALRNNGTIAIWDFSPSSTNTATDAVTSSFALLFRISSQSRLYDTRELEQWLVEAGFSDVCVKTPPMSSHALITARKQED